MKINLKFKISNFKLKEGFTLIELLIVIAIIGILSAILMANLVGVRQRARDAQRKSDLRQIQSALELYRADVGSYPLPSTSGFSTLPYIPSTSICPGSPTVPVGSLTSPDATVKYMQKIPCNPLSTCPNGLCSVDGPGTDYYYYSATGATYTLKTCLENTQDNDPNDVATTTGGAGQCGIINTKMYILNNP